MSFVTMLAFLVNRDVLITFILYIKVRYIHKIINYPYVIYNLQKKKVVILETQPKPNIFTVNDTYHNIEPKLYSIILKCFSKL